MAEIINKIHFKNSWILLNKKLIYIKKFDGIFLLHHLFCYGNKKMLTYTSWKIYNDKLMLLT